MEPVLVALDQEWDRVVSSAAGRSAFERWGRCHHPALAQLDDLASVPRLRPSVPGIDDVHRSLAELAVGGDSIAALTLLKALVPGLVRIAVRFKSQDEDVFEELLSLAWERIRTYPCHRPGLVKTNILLDVRKRYLTPRDRDTAATPPVDAQEIAGDAPSVEDEVMGRLLLARLATAQRHGMISAAALETILRTRVGGESLAEVAEDQRTSVRSARHRRWRAETRLRSLKIAA